ncbi:MAG TPA: hypothetical protein VNA15_05440 [Candidatus Angelobacter sp.]|nr:hypothetical protein [Candidatus Angelobacter sp.]
MLSKLVRFLKSHPVLLLLLLTPGIPEYLSASSQLTVLILSPPLFFLFLAANLGLYGSGVILIREAMIRWKKGWASVFLLGVAYGIVEEGLDLWTLFYSKAGPVGNLGYYGHWLGVNWVWTVGLLIFHSVYSIGLPIFLFGLAFPELKRKSLVSGTRLSATIVCLILDSIFLFVFVSAIYSGYSPGGTLLLFSGLVATIFVLLARRLPANFLKISPGQPKWSPRKFAFLGVLLFPATLLAGGIAAGANIPPIIPMVVDIIFAVFILTRAFNAMGVANNQEQKVAFGVGLVIPIAVFGLIASIGLANPLIVVADLFFVLFSRRLWRKWHQWSLLHRPAIQTSLPGFGDSPAPLFP